MPFKFPNSNADTLKGAAEDHDVRLANLERAVVLSAQVPKVDGQTDAQAIAAAAAGEG
jgi:hypothetical protein